MHNSKEDLDRYYNPKQSRGSSGSITIPPHGIIPAVYSIETGSYYHQPRDNSSEEENGFSKTVKITFVLLLLTTLFVGFVFAILSVTRLSKV